MSINQEWTSHPLDTICIVENLNSAAYFCKFESLILNTIQLAGAYSALIKGKAA